MVDSSRAQHYSTSWRKRAFKIPIPFASFAAAIAFMMILTSLLVGLAKASVLRQLQASTVWIKRVSGAMLNVVGLYLGYYYIAAGM